MRTEILAHVTMRPALYITELEISARSKNQHDLKDPTSDPEINIRAQCMEFKPGRKTLLVTRSLIVKDNRLFWPYNNQFFEALNIDEANLAIIKFLEKI